MRIQPERTLRFKRNIGGAMNKTDQHLNPEQIAFCAEAIISGQFAGLPEKYRVHLQECSKCADEVVTVADISISLTNEEFSPSQSEDPVTSKTPGRKTIYRKLSWVITAAAAAIIFGMILLYPPWFFQPQKDHTLAEQYEQIPLTEDPMPVHPELPEQKADVLIPETQEQLERDDRENIQELTAESKPDNEDSITLLAYFEPDPSLEQLYQNMQGAFRGHQVRVISDKEVHFSQDTQLQWENPQSQTLYLELFNNRGEELISITTSEESYTLPSLDQGLYYWKLISEDFDLLFVGKILVKP